MLLIASLPSVLGAAAILPALMLLWLVIVTDRRPEPPGLVWLAFLLGVVSLFLTGYLRMPFAPLLQHIAQPWPSILARAAFVAAIPEETAKVTPIALLVARLRAVHEPMDGLVYGAAVGLGFAAWENLGYLVYYPEEWITLAAMRSVLTVPFHGALGMIAGTYLAEARFAGALGARRHGRRTRIRLIASAWLVPVMLHVLFDIPVLAMGAGLNELGIGTPVLLAAGPVVGVSAIALAVMFARRLAAHQKNLPAARAVPYPAWRRIWAVLVAGGAAGFAGAAVVTSEADQAWHTGSGVHPVPLALGVSLLVVAAAVLLWGRRQLLADIAARPAVSSP